MKHLLLCICCAICTPLFSQQLLKGKLISTKDNSPIANASVYLSNTTVGTISNEDGSFVIHAFPEGIYDLVVSSVGYQTYARVVKSESLPKDLVIKLTPKPVDLKELVVNPFFSEDWKKWGKLFMDNLIGKTPNAAACKLKNRHVVYFQYFDNPEKILVKAREPLIIENEALGYILTYDLDLFEFHFKSGFWRYQGYPRFTEMETTDTALVTQWRKGREDAYRGSLMHFLRSVYHNQVIEEGFVVNKKKASRKEKNADGTTTVIPAIVLPTPLTALNIALPMNKKTVKLQYINRLIVTYPAKTFSSSYINFWDSIQTNNPTQYEQQAKIVEDSIKIIAGQTPVYTELLLKSHKNGVDILYNGHYYEYSNLMLTKYWAWWDKLCNMLPLDYGNPKPANAEAIFKDKNVDLIMDDL